MSEEKNKARLIKDALKIVDELAKYDIDNISSYDKEELEELEELIEKAKKLKKDRLWKLN